MTSDTTSKGETLTGIELTQTQRARLLGALEEAGLAGQARQSHWDSLDIVAALAVVEDEVGVALPHSLRLQKLAGADDLIAMIRERGETSRRARLRLDFSTGGEPWSQRELRHKEYRLALANPGSSVSVSVGSRTTVLMSAESPITLPVARDLLTTLDLAEEDGVISGASQSARVSAMPPPRANPRTRAAVVEAIAAVVARVERLGGYVRPPMPATISVEALKRSGYYDAHPEQMIMLGREYCLLPAACLHVYEDLFTEEEATLFTFTQSVFRREIAYDAQRGRLPSFWVQEIVWKSTSEEADVEMAAAVADVLHDVVLDAGVTCEWREADDPFFVAHPTDKTAKQELVVPVADTWISVASVNRHGQHYSSRFCARPEMLSGCAGLGLDRLALALAQTE